MNLAIEGYTKHIYGKVACICGYETQSAPNRAKKEAGWSVDMGEWISFYASSSGFGHPVDLPKPHGLGYEISAL